MTVEKSTEEINKQACKKMALAGAVARRNRNQRFSVGDNVIAMWKRRNWFLTHVTSCHDDGQYNVYFPGDGTTKDGLKPDEVRPVDVSSSVYSRGDMLNRTFYFDGDTDLEPGQWKVRRMNHEKNVYICTRLTGGTPTSQNCEEFDIGYVISQVVSQEQKERES